jgi:hypothetical protein
MSNKSDAANAEGCFEAMSHPTIRLVSMTRIAHQDLQAS